MIKVGTLNATTTEAKVAIDSELSPMITIIADADCAISFNDNSHYQTYKAGEKVELQDRRGSIVDLYYKTLTSTAIIRYWVM